MSKLVGVVYKSSRERIEVRACVCNGHAYIDVRAYWRTKDGNAWKASRKGVTLELVGELIAILKIAG